jgi:hypothetical protein
LVCDVAAKMCEAVAIANRARNIQRQLRDDGVPRRSSAAQ